MIHLKGGAILAALMVAQPAHAADFITYTFQTTGSGLATYLDNLTGTRSQQLVSGVAITYVLPITGFYGENYTRPTSNGIEFNSPTTTLNTYAGGSSILSATASALTLSEIGTVPRGQRGSTTATACGDIGGAFPTQTFASVPGCGAVAIDYVGRTNTLNFTGTVNRVDVALGIGTPVQPYGLAGFTTFVPEPATWALMLAGFGMVSYAMRRRRSQVMYA